MRRLLNRLQEFDDLARVGLVLLLLLALVVVLAVLSGANPSILRDVSDGIDLPTPDRGQTCCTHGPTGAPGGLSHEAAIARAIEVAPVSGTAPSVIWAGVESDPFVPGGLATPGRLVWVVRLQGGLTPSACPTGFLELPPMASSSACLDVEGGVNVVLDYFTGELLGWVH